MARPDLVIISDLHMCDGGSREKFLPDDDQALARFLDELARYTPVDLIVNGDFIDFVKIQPRPKMWFDHHLDASEHESLEKLEYALAAHAVVFDALAHLVERGGRIRFHFGNHDIDLVWPAVQRRLRMRLGSGEGGDGRVQFGWAYRVGGVYVEHGNQADPPDRFADPRAVTRPDPAGAPRLERTWGMRLTEEFYNELTELPGLAMLDNVRPILRAAALIVEYGLGHPSMYPVLRRGVEVLAHVLVLLRTEEDLQYAAEQIGVPVAALHLIAAAAGFLGLRPIPEAATVPAWAVPPSLAPKGRLDPQAVDQVRAQARAGQLPLPALNRSYRLGQARSGDPVQLAVELPSPKPPLVARGMPMPPASGAASGSTAAGQEAYTSASNRKFITYAAGIGTGDSTLSAICFGHTHQATEARLSVDGRPGWPLPGTSCRYYNSGTWMRSLNLDDPRWANASFEDLRNPASYRKEREVIHVRWPVDDATPEVAMRRWETPSGEQPD